MTGRLIDADALLKHKSDHETISTHLIWNAPTVDAVPVDDWLLNHYEVGNDYQNKIIDELVSLYRAERREE